MKKQPLAMISVIAQLLLLAYIQLAEGNFCKGEQESKCIFLKVTLLYPAKSRKTDRDQDR